MTIARRLALIVISGILAGCAQAPLDQDSIRADQDPWERVGTVIAKK